MKEKNVIKYDRNNRKEYVWVCSIGLLYTFRYYTKESKEFVKLTLVSPRNTSNYKTITKAVKNNKIWENISCLEIGEKYIIYYDFRKNYTRKFNKITKSTTIEQILRGTDDNYIRIINHNGKKSIGFKIDVNKIK